VPADACAEPGRIQGGPVLSTTMAAHHDRDANSPGRGRRYATERAASQKVQGRPGDMTIQRSTFDGCTPRALNLPGKAQKSPREVVHFRQRRLTAVSRPLGATTNWKM
jgi:hypothetical protein